MNEEAEKEKMILKELDNLTPKESSADDNDILEIVSNLKLNYENMPHEIKKQAILLIFDYIKVDKINKTRGPEAYEIREVKWN